MCSSSLLRVLDHSKLFAEAEGMHRVLVLFHAKIRTNARDNRYYLLSLVFVLNFDEGQDALGEAHPYSLSFVGQDLGR